MLHLLFVGLVINMPAANIEDNPKIKTADTSFGKDIRHRSRPVGVAQPMSELLRKSWILPAVLCYIGHSEEYAESLMAPKICQLIEVINPHLFHSFEYGSSSERKVLLKSRFQTSLTTILQSLRMTTVTKLEKYGFTMWILLCSSDRERSLESCRGGIIKLTRFSLRTCFKTGDAFQVSQCIVPIIVHEFEYVAGQGSPNFGDPRYVLAVPVVRQALMALPFEQIVALSQQSTSTLRTYRHVVYIQ